MYALSLLCSIHIQQFKYYTKIYDINNIIPTCIIYMGSEKYTKRNKKKVENSTV